MYYIMNPLDTVVHHGKINAKGCYPKRIEDVNTNIPYFEIYRNDMGRYDMKAYNYEGHDNAPRMDYYQQYFKSSIFPNIEKGHDITGYYNIELHDSYTYLRNGKDYKNCLVFSKFKNDVGPVLLPDPYMVGGYGNILRYEDKITWDKKRDVVHFCGTTTGDRNPHNNQRINLCLWSLANRNRYQFYITKIAQMSPDDITSCFPDFHKIYSQNGFSLEDQLSNKFIMHVDGNTSRFDVWPFKSNSVVLKYKSKEMLWYYDMMIDKTHFREVDVNTIDSVVNHCLSNPTECQITAFNAKRFVNDILQPISHQVYTTSLFETIAANK